MAPIIQFPTDEPILDEEFKPTQKLGLLVIGKSLYTGFAEPHPNSEEFMDLTRWDYRTSGNLNIYDWELLMSGRIDFGEHCPLNQLNEITGLRNDGGVTKLLKPPETMAAGLDCLVNQFKSMGTQDGKYKEVAKIWPGTSEVLSEYHAAVERFSEISDDDTLTTMIIFSHGFDGSIDMGDLELQYNELLADLDTIKGKKSVFVYACHSGSFLKTLRLHPQRRDYAAITSCEADNQSTNWNDGQLNGLLFKHFRQGGKYSGLEVVPITGQSPQVGERHTSLPQMLRYFDVKLI